LGVPSASKKTGGTSLEDLIDSAIQAFHSVWAAFGSFEKGETFGFPRIIANVNMSSSSKAFEKSVLYGQNIAPFVYPPGDKSVDYKTGSCTYALDSHPLRELLNEVKRGFVGSVDEARQPSREERNARARRRPPLDAELDSLINRTAKEFNINLSLASINKLDQKQLLAFYSAVDSKCTSKALEKKFASILTDNDLPPRSGRRYLRHFWERLIYLESANASSSSSSSGPA
jgi:hypothetical protein